MSRNDYLNNICNFFDKASNVDKGILMHAIRSYLPPSRKVKGSLRSVLEGFDTESLERISGDCDYNRNTTTEEES